MLGKCGCMEVLGVLVLRDVLVLHKTFHIRSERQTLLISLNK